jgi:nicotinate-nucleotide adenylyltransferase
MVEPGTSLSAGPGPRYGILGGTFDPPHLAHLALAQEAVVRLGLDTVFFVPAGQPPHKVGRLISPASQRRAMVERAIEDNSRFVLSTVELDHPGPSYTVDTLRRLRELAGPAAELHLILGWDMLVDLPHWHDPVGVVAEATRLVVAHRPGAEASPDADVLHEVALILPALPAKVVLLAAPQLNISASMLRQRVASSLPIRYLVPDAVARYVAEHGLYRSAASSRSVEAAGGSAQRSAPAPEGEEVSR